MTFPSPLAEMIPSSVAVNAMNGRIVPTTISIVSRPAWKQIFTTRPTTLPMRTTIFSFFPSFAFAISSFVCAFYFGCGAEAAVSAACAAGFHLICPA